MATDDFDLRVIPGYHEEEVFDPEPSNTFDILYQFIWQSKTWLYFGYFLAYEFFFFHLFFFFKKKKSINSGFHVVLLELFFHSFMQEIWIEMHKFIGLLILLFRWQ